MEACRFTVAFESYQLGVMEVAVLRDASGLGEGN